MALHQQIMGSDVTTSMQHCTTPHIMLCRPAPIRATESITFKTNFFRTSYNAKLSPSHHSQHYMEVNGWFHTMATLYLREVPNGTPRICCWMRLRSSYGKFVDEKNLFPARAETQFLGRLACVLFNTQITLTDM